MDQDVPPPEFNVPLEKFTFVISGFSTLTAFVLTSMMLFIKIFDHKSHKKLMIIFFSAIAVYHLFRVLTNVLSKKRTDIKLINKLLFNSDLHMFIINLLFMDIPYINIFFITDYFLLTLIDSVEFLVDFISPVVKIEENFVIIKIKHYLYTPLIPKISAYVEILVSIGLLREVIRKKKKMRTKFIHLFVIYFIFVNMKNFVFSDFFYDQWMKFNINLRNRLLNKKGFFKDLIEKLLTIITSSLRTAKDYSQNRDIKSHTE